MKRMKSNIDNPVYLDRLEPKRVKQYKDEVFIRIPGHDNYYISQYGSLYSLHRNRLIQPHLRGEKTQERLSYTLSIPDEGSSHYLAHRLVAEVFVKNKNPEKIHVHHKDGNSRNNHYKNLMWVDPYEHKLIETGVELYTYNIANGSFKRFKSFRQLGATVGKNIYQRVRKRIPHFTYHNGMDGYRFDDIEYKGDPLYVAIKRIGNGQTSPA